MKTFEELIALLGTWLQDLDGPVDAKNATITDGVTLKMPRTKDLVVTFPEDSSVEPEQLPAIVLEVEGSMLEHVAPVRGAMAASLYLVEEAQTASKARLKLSRWVGVIRSHCTSGASLLDSNIRIVPRRESYVMGKAKGDLNAFQLKVDLIVTF